MLSLWRLIVPFIQYEQIDCLLQMFKIQYIQSYKLINRGSFRPTATIKYICSFIDIDTKIKVFCQPSDIQCWQTALGAVKDSNNHDFQAFLAVSKHMTPN